MKNKETKTIADTFQSVSESYTVTACRNGFVIEISGQIDQDTYKNDRFIFNTLEQLKTAVQDISYMPRS